MFFLCLSILVTYFFTKYIFTLIEYKFLYTVFQEVAILRDYRYVDPK